MSELFFKVRNLARERRLRDEELFGRGRKALLRVLGMGTFYRVKVPRGAGSGNLIAKSKVCVARRRLKEAGGKPLS